MKDKIASRCISLSALMTLALAGCGGGGSSTPAPTPTPTPVPTPTPAPTPAPAPAPVTLNDCFNNDTLYATGTTYEVDENQTSDSGATFSDHDFNVTVNGPVSFAGATAIESEETVTSASDSSFYSHEKLYSNKTASDIFDYGYVSLNSIAVTTYYDPAIKTPLSLKVGESFTQDYDEHSDGGGSDSAAPYEQVITFMGTESVTAPAGTFVTCKIKYDSTPNPTNPGSTTSTRFVWFIKDGRYKGLVAKVSQGTDQNPAAYTDITKLVLNGS